MEFEPDPANKEYATSILKQELLDPEPEGVKSIRNKALEIAGCLKGKEGSREEVTKLRDLYQQAAQEYSNDPKEQLAIMFASALVLREYGAESEFSREIDDAIEFAEMMGFSEYADLLSALK